MYTGYTSLLFNLFSHKMTVAKNNVSFFLYYHKILFCRKIGPVIFRLRQPLLRPLSTITILAYSTGNVSVLDVSRQ